MKWQTCRIADLGRIVTGSTPPTSERKFYGSVCPLIKPTDMASDGFRIGSTEESLSKEGYELFKNRVVPAETTCVVTIGTIGKLCLTKEASVCNQAVNSIVANRQSHDPYFVFYLMKMCIPKVKFLSSGTASGRENVSKSAFEGIEVKVPLLSIQKRVGSILRNYDELIEVSQRRIRVLEAMARALYREWFVAFRFPGHDKTRLVASSLGGIPQGWEVKKLGEIAEDMRRNVPKGELDEPKPYVGLEHIPRRSLALDAWEMATDLGSNKLEFRKGEVLFGKIRPYFHKVSVAPFDGLCSADTIVIRARRPEYYAFVVACVSSNAFVAEASATANGVKMPRANWDVLEKYEIVIPRGKVAEQFSALFADIITQQQALIFQIQNLRRTRDLLLPRLLSGNCSLKV